MPNTASYALPLKSAVWYLGDPRGTETILLVDDDVDVRRLFAMSLRALGYAVMSAADAGEAMQLAERHPATIHLLLSDLNMPGPSRPRLVRGREGPAAGHAGGADDRGRSGRGVHGLRGTSG